MNVGVNVLIVVTMCLTINLNGQSEEPETSQSERIIQRLEEATELTLAQKSLIEKKVQELELDKLHEAFRNAVKEANEFLRTEVLTDAQQKEIRESSLPKKMVKKFEKKIELTEDQKVAIEAFMVDKSNMISMEPDPEKQGELLVDLRKEIVASILNDEQRSQLKASRGK